RCGLPEQRLHLFLVHGSSLPKDSWRFPVAPEVPVLKDSYSNDGYRVPWVSGRLGASNPLGRADVQPLFTGQRGYHASDIGGHCA
ncbi:MAG: hypothetical protein ABI884_10515, partial [Gemmatimonadota bacterium]